MIALFKQHLFDYRDLWRCIGVMMATLSALASVSRSLAATPVTLGPVELKAIEHVIVTEMTKQKIPAISIAISRDNRIVFARAYGLSDLESKVRANVESKFRLASVSKPITAVGVLQLAEAGKLDLDQAVQRYCPSFPEKQWPITTRQLLSHTAGVRHYKDTGGSDWTNPEVNSTRHYADIISSLGIFKDNPLLFEPGTQWSYSTYGYSVLGCAIEGASGEKYMDFIRDHVLLPAGMNDTVQDNATGLVRNRVRGYGENSSGAIENAPLSDTSNKLPGGGLLGTSSDLARFANALNTGKLISPATRKEMFSEVATRDGKGTGYALGWFILSRNGIPVVRHGGSSQGATAGLYLIPSKGYALAILASKQDVNTFQLDKQITSLVVPLLAATPTK